VPARHGSPNAPAASATTGQRRPDLREAFLTGYGRPLDGDDLALLVRHAVVGAVSGIVWAREHRDAGFERHHREMLANLMRDEKVTG
jgi:hypothetical protein